jgi:glycosyltransferase involved in cell wall biosynthesis
VVQHGHNGIVVPARSSESLAAAIEKLLGDSQLRMQLARRSRELAVLHFAQDAVVDHVLALYDELLNREESAFQTACS